MTEMQCDKLHATIRKVDDMYFMYITYPGTEIDNIQFMFDRERDAVQFFDKAVDLMHAADGVKKLVRVLAA